MTQTHESEASYKLEAEHPVVNRRLLGGKLGWRLARQLLGGYEYSGQSHDWRSWLCDREALRKSTSTETTLKPFSSMTLSQ